MVSSRRLAPSLGFEVWQPDSIETDATAVTNLQLSVGHPRGAVDGLVELRFLEWGRNVPGFPIEKDACATKMGGHCALWPKCEIRRPPAGKGSSRPYDRSNKARG